MEFNLVLITDRNMGISSGGAIPQWPGMREAHGWIVDNMGAIIMGRKAWASGVLIPGRINVVVSREYTMTTIGVLSPQPILFAPTLAAALKWVSTRATRCTVWAGNSLARAAIASPWLCRAHHIIMRGDPPAEIRCDKMLNPAVITALEAAESRGLYSVLANHYTEYNFTSAEGKYLVLLARMLAEPPRPNRTQTPTRGMFSQQLQFPLTDNRGPIIPLLTCKRTAWAAIYHELIWFLRGSTDTSYLVKHGVKIWDGNSTRAAHDAAGHHDYAEGEVGPIYGWQWRHWGKSWQQSARSGSEDRDISPDAPDATPGIDQLARVIAELKANPFSRRLLVSAWNVADLESMALPPCHYSFQFYVAEAKHTAGKTLPDPSTHILNCAVNMRSADLALGVPFNIASYALLTHIIAAIVDMRPGTLSLNMVDCHIYEDHIPGIEKMQVRIPRRAPTITLPAYSTLAEFTAGALEDYVIGDYIPHPPIPLRMAV